MKNTDMEKRIAEAVEHAAPDVMDRVLEGCGARQSGTVIPLFPARRKQRNRGLASLTALAAVLALCVGVFGFLTWQTVNAVDSVVMLDVNPSISLEVNRKEKVIQAAALNEDGAAVLGEMDLEGSSLEVAVNAIIGSMLRTGYLSELQNAILVSVENSDAQRAEELQTKIAGTIDTVLQNSALSPAVLSQSVSESQALRALALEHGISVGKAALVQEVVRQDPTLTVESLAPLTVSEIALISQSRHLDTETVAQTGTASAGAYIGQDAAVEIVCSYAGVSSGEVTRLEVEFDSENGVMVYEVEFRAGDVEYECDVNARTGEIVKYETENKGAAGRTSTGGEYIGEDGAKTAALADAGLTLDDVKYCNAWLEYDDGRPEHYEVAFEAGGVQYKYEVDLYSAAVLERHCENDTEHHSDHHQSGNTSPSVAADIGREAALAAALDHAGVSESQVRELEIDYDVDDGVALYEIEFECGEYEYEYEIDAATGAVLKYDIDD